MGTIFNSKVFNGVSIAGKRASGLVKNGVVFWKKPFEAIFNTQLTEVGSTDSNQLELKFSATNFMPIIIYWGDGTKSEIPTYNSPLLKKTYATAGIYTVIVEGSSFSFYWNNVPESRKLIGIISNGNNIFIANAFYGCRNNTSIGNDCDLLNLVTNGTNIFRQNALTSLPSGITLSALTTGIYMFDNNALTSLPSGMILSSLTNGQNMFRQNALTSLPSTMTLNNLTNGIYMFYLNQLTSLPSGMILSSLTNGQNMFYLNTIDTERYSKLLIDMNNSNANINVLFHGGSSKYNSTAISSRENLVNVKKWTITDSGLQN